METGKCLYIIAGCNGAGKTTASYTILPDIWQCCEFVNADEIAKGISPFNPESVAIEAGQLMLSRIETLIRLGVSFSIESTLATKSYKNLIRKVQAIPPDIIVRRYHAGINNLFSIYMDTVDYWVIANNTKGTSEYVAEGGRAIQTEIFDSKTYNKILQYVRE